MFQLLFSKFTELLEDLHVWASAHSRPSGRGLLHTPRLNVAFALLCAYACLAALATAAGHEQVGRPFLKEAPGSRSAGDALLTQALVRFTVLRGGYSREGTRVLEASGDVGLVGAEVHGAAAG